MEKEDLELLKQVHSKHRTKLRQYPRVVGTMISTKKVNGKDTGTPCITVLVREKISRPFLIETEVVPQSVDDVPTDVVESGEIRKVGIGKQGKLRPAPRGASIGHYHITAG